MNKVCSAKLIEMFGEYKWLSTQNSSNKNSFMLNEANSQAPQFVRNEIRMKFLNKNELPQKLSKP